MVHFLFNGMKPHSLATDQRNSTVQRLIPVLPFHHLSRLWNGNADRVTDTLIQMA